MLEEIAIIALSLFNALGLISVDRNGESFLGQFIDAGRIAGNGYAADYQSPADLSAVVPVHRSLDVGGLTKENELSPLPEKVAYGGLTIQASGALAMDQGTDLVLFEKDARVRRPIASLTKIMTALIVLENSELDDTVTISSAAMGVLGGKEGLAAGEKIRLGELMRVMLIDSNNTAGFALAEHAGGSVDGFVELMNRKAYELGLEDTRFYNPTGLDEAPDRENHSTAYDLAQLTEYALKYPLIWEITRTPATTVRSLDGKLKHDVKNTDELLASLGNIYGGKTGFTEDAGECLVLISESEGAKHKVITVVLDAQDRFQETKKMTDWVFGNYRW